METHAAEGCAEMNVTDEPAMTGDFRCEICSEMRERRIQVTMTCGESILFSVCAECYSNGLIHAMREQFNRNLSGLKA